MILPEQNQTGVGGGNRTFLLFLFVPTPESQTFRKWLKRMAGMTRLELATSAVTIQQLTRHAGTAKRSASHIRPHEWWAGLWVGKSGRWPRVRRTGNLFRAVIVLIA